MNFIDKYIKPIGIILGIISPLGLIGGYVMTKTAANAVMDRQITELEKDKEECVKQRAEFKDILMTLQSRTQALETDEVECKQHRHEVKDDHLMTSTLWSEYLLKHNITK